MSGGRERWKIMIRRARKPLRAEGWTVTEAVAKLGCTRQTFIAPEQTRQNQRRRDD